MNTNSDTAQICTDSTLMVLDLLIGRLNVPRIPEPCLVSIDPMVKSAEISLAAVNMLLSCIDGDRRTPHGPAYSTRRSLIKFVVEAQSSKRQYPAAILLLRNDGTHRWQDVRDIALSYWGVPQSVWPNTELELYGIRINLNPVLQEFAEHDQEQHAHSATVRKCSNRYPTTLEL